MPPGNMMRHPTWSVLSSELTLDIHHVTFAIALSFTLIATFSIALRLSSRIYLASGILNIEDYLICAAWLLAISVTAIIGIQIKIDTHTIGKDRLNAIHSMLKLLFVQSILFNLSINLVKASFIFQYLRLFALTLWVKITCYTLMVLIVAAAAWGVFGVVFLCRPVHKYWDELAFGMCINAEVEFWTTSCIGIFLDWAIWLLPMPAVARLHLPRRQKMCLLVCFGLGVLICMASILRLVLVREVARAGQFAKSGTYTLIFSTIEMNIAITCASLLVVKPLFLRFVPSIVSEPPMSAREDRRLWQGITGQNLLQEAPAGDDVGPQSHCWNSDS